MLAGRSGKLFLMMLVLNGCAKMDVNDFKGTSPRLTLESYFEGETKAWGLFEDRFGKVRKFFTVDMTGYWKDGLFILDERFLYDDGEQEQRIWHIRKIDEHNYKATAEGVIGEAEGRSYGNALNWRYDFDLKVGDSTWRVRFDDWMFLQTDGVMINRARVTKWGFDIGSVTLAFQKQEADKLPQ